MSAPPARNGWPGSGVQKSTYGQQILAAVLMAKARGEGEIGMTAVAEVIRNRAAKAGRSPLQIVLKPGEFSCLNDTTPAAPGSSDNPVTAR